MAGKGTRPSRSTNSLAAAADGRGGYGLLADKHAKLLLAASVGILVLTVVFTCSGMGRPAREKQHASPAAKQDGPVEPTTVKRPLPEHLAEDQVPKWVPYRQVSGRVELEPWDSVDADTARDPYARLDIMAAREARSPDDSGTDEGGWDEGEGAAGETAERSSSTAEAAADESGKQPSPPTEATMDALEAGAPAPEAEAGNSSEETG